MNQHELTRRRLIGSVIALSGLAGSTFGLRVFPLSRAWAESTSPLVGPQREALVDMARLLFPHDALSDDVYADVLDQALSDVASSSEFAAHLDAAASVLEQHPGGSWWELDEAGQIEAMQNIESEPYFVAIQEHVRAGIYNGAAFWKHVGYAGPAVAFGGYLHRGAGEIDWLPEDE